MNNRAIKEDESRSKQEVFMFADELQSNRDMRDMPPAHWNDNYGEIMIYAVLLLNKQLERTDDEYADFRCRGA